MQKKACFIFLAIVLFGLQMTAQKKETKPGSENTRANNTAYIEALNQKIQENYVESIQMFENILKKYPNDHASMYELADLYFIQKEYLMAIKWATKATELAPDNDWYFLQLSDVYIENNEPEKAVVILERLCKKNPGNMEYVENLIMAYIMVSDFEKAIAQINVIESQQGISEELSMEKYKIYKSTGKEKKANVEIEKLIEAFPTETRYYSILADSYMEMGMKKEAFKIYEKILEINPNDPYVHIALADYYRQEGNLEKAKEELKIGFKNPDLDFKTKLQLVGILIQISQQSGQISDNDVKDMLKTITQAHPDEPEAWGLYAEIAFQDKNYAEAQNALLKMVSSDSTRYTTWEMLLYADYALEDFKSMAQHASSAARLFPLQPLPFMFGGISNYQLGNYAKAIQMLERGKDFVYDDPKTLEEFYILLGDSYHQLKNDEKCFYYYEKVLEKDSRNALILNNYAYYLAVLGKDLEKAEKMSFESLKIDPNNSNNMDTYGWVLYKMKRYDDAALWIKKALEKEPDSGTLNDHYGDVLYKMGKIDEAVDHWKKAKDADGEEIENIDKKINDRKLYD